MKRRIDEKTIRITEILTAATVMVTGLILMLAGLKVLPFSVEKYWLVAVFGCFFVTSLIVAVLQKNGIAVTLSLMFGILTVAQILVAVGLDIRNVYPVYVVSLPVSVAAGAALSKLPSIVTKVALAFVGASLLLFLESAEILTVAVVLPIIAIYMGALGLIYSAQKLRKKNTVKEKNNESDS